MSRNPHFVQIGLDFGTAYSKCICRDVMIDKAWVHIPSTPKDKELPFLIPSIVYFKDGRLFADLESKSHYPEHGLYHLKQALEKIALGRLDDPSLKPYKRAIGCSDNNRLIALVEASVTFFLAWIINDVRKHVTKRLKHFGEHPDDYLAINLAVPVADAQRPEVNNLYNRVLCQAWLLSENLNGKQSIDLMEIDNSRRKTGHLMIESCYIYPEVSANVQGFVRSRASRQGMYLFSDTGAGTVDQSLFIFQRSENGEQLAYLHGSVLPIGSSFIEHYAADEITNGDYDWQCLEQLRREKEIGAVSPHIERARKKLHKELDRGTTATIAMARKKLFNRDQIRDISVIFGGGGHCDNPYKRGALSPFSGCLFSPDVIPDVIGIPDPVDLELEAANKRWLPRLSVAYGLSFVKSELARFIYPVDIQDPSPQEIWRPFSKTVDAASKELC
ncbi:hypothetical protein [Trichlorobacter lovleyi]|uniref:hypothetical protein n=1 Tax=Trichlorobacter lovleyi TaxID=313985 RepID=UPI00247FE015|nr:hypothetical protein [Trichlorobacter lovleyi]